MASIPLSEWFAEGTRVRLSSQHITFKACWGTVRYVDGDFVGVEFDDGDKRAVRSSWLVKIVATEPCTCTYEAVGDGTNECPRTQECYENWLTR